MKIRKPISVFLALFVSITPAVMASGMEENVEFKASYERFADINKDGGYADSVRWAVENGLMYGVSEDEFAPDNDTTRAMAVTMLWRMAGMPDAAAKSLFTDVNDDMWYADAAAWAVSIGVVKGTGETEFSPDAPVTREQIASMLYRYAQNMGRGFTGEWAFLLDFPDADKVSGYAYEPLCFMTMNGIVTGMEDGALAPDANVTRARIAIMLRRFFLNSLSYEEFKGMDAERQKQAFAEMTGKEIYELVKNSSENWPVT